jgi:hypothetical protein
MNEASQNVTLIEIKGQIQHIIDGIDTIKEKQIALAEDVTRIKEAVYHPDVGLYARLRELDARLKGFESFRSNTTKVMWIIIVGCITLAFAVFQKQITN